MRTISHYDRTCDTTEEWSFLNTHKDLLKNTGKMWHFDQDEVHEIAMIYYKLLKESESGMKDELPSKNFSNFLHKAFGFADDSLIERIFVALDGITTHVSLKTYLSTMSLYLRGTMQEKVRYCFKVYDLGGKMEIKRDQMVNLLRRFVYKHQEEDIEESVKDLVDIIIKKIDLDKDGVVSFADYSSSVRKEPMFLECFGQVLPDRKHCYAFLTTFTDKIKEF